MTKIFTVSIKFYNKKFCIKLLRKILIFLYKFFIQIIRTLFKNAKKIYIFAFKEFFICEF